MCNDDVVDGSGRAEDGEKCAVGERVPLRAKAAAAVKKAADVADDAEQSEEAAGDAPSK